MSNLFRLYRRLLHEHPFVTNVLTSCTFMTTGDLVSQGLLQEKDHIDLKQTARFATVGLLFVGPVVRGSLVMIDKLFGPTKTVKILAKKLMVDQLIGAPAFLAGNITVLTLLERGSFEEVGKELEKSYFSILRLNYSFWPFVQMINFYLIPLTYRVLFGSSAALVWNTIFSYRLYNQKVASQTDTDQ